MCNADDTNVCLQVQFTAEELGPSDKKNTLLLQGVLNDGGKIH